MISLYDILEASNGQLFGEPAAQIFTDFCLDSRLAKESELFIALRTDQGDTHQYIEEAIRNGVSGVVCAEPPECNTEGVSVIITRNVQTALMSWSHYVLGKLGTHVIGVTGSSGKSLTTEAICRILSTQYAVHHGDLEINGPLSIPLALAQLTPEHKLVVLKLEVRQPGEMGEMVQALQPEVGVVTHSGLAFLDSFEAPEHFAQELGVLTDYLSPSGLAALNFDDDMVRELSSRAHVSTFGIDRFGADLMAYNVLVGPSGTGFDLRNDSERYVGRWIPFLGKHQLYSVLAALSVGLFYDIPIDDGLQALRAATHLHGRMNPLKGIHDSLLIDDTYAASSDSTLSALDWLAAVKDEGQRSIFIMGDMDSLGAYSQRGHRLVGQRAGEVADYVITVGMEAAQAARAAVDHGMPPDHVFTSFNPQDAVSTLMNRCAPTSNDIVLVKGGGSGQMELVVRNLLLNEADQAQLVRQEAAWMAATITQHTHPSWVDIDTQALAGNVRAVKKIIGKDVTLMAVVKANAYGHGAVTAARTALLNGAEYLGVASINEAMDLREAGIEAPILVLSYAPVYAIHQAVRHNLTMVLYDLDMATAYNRVARDVGSTLRVHIKVDTGMGRLGVASDKAIHFFRNLLTLKNLEVEGICTHFSSADSNNDYTKHQLDTFRDILRPLRAGGFSFKYMHTANSAATLSYPDSHFNMVRVGIALYGLTPSGRITMSDEFKPVMSWKTSIAQVKTLPPNHPVGYGNTYNTLAEERIAVIPVGYADGFRRAPNNWGEVLVHGQRAKVIGRVSMEKTAINVTHISGVSIGDEVVLLGRQGKAAITAEEIAANLGTVNYEVLTSVLPRVPRR